MKHFVISAATVLVLFAMMASTFAAPPPTGTLWLNGQQVRTIVPPANVPAGTGTDPLYMVPNQDAVAGVGPGEPGYHGGRWAVYLVEWNAGVTPYALTSDEAVLAAQTAGHITITRAPNLDNRCPIQGH